MTLAKRLVFTGPTRYLSGAGWRVRMVLAWQRLVRAGKVRQRRRSAPLWRAAEQERVRRLAGLQAAEVRRGAAAGWATGAGYGGTRYEWRLQEEIAGSSGVTSGAAAVLARRRRAVDECERDGRSPPQRQRTSGDGSPGTLGGESGRRKRGRVGYGEDCAREERKRRRDAFGDG